MRPAPVAVPPSLATARRVFRAALPAGLLLLAACGTTPPLASEIAACRAEVTAAIGSGDYQPSRMRRVDECMRRRGWRPTPACLETMQEGTGFCDYQR